MSYATITGITIAIAVVVVIGIGLLSYMSSLIKSAYQIKVEMRSDLEAGLKKVEEEIRQKSKWMRSEVGEDVTKMKQALERENEERLKQIQERLQTAIRELEEGSRAERNDLRAAVAGTRKKLTTLEQDLTALKDEAARRAAIGRPPRKDKDGADKDSADKADGKDRAELASATSAAMSGAAGKADDDDALLVGEPDPAPRTKAPAAAPVSAGGSAGDTTAGRAPAGNRTTTAGATNGTKRVHLQDFGKTGQ